MVLRVILGVSVEVGDGVLLPEEDKEAVALLESDGVSLADPDFESVALFEPEALSLEERVMLGVVLVVSVGDVDEVSLTD